MGGEERKAFQVGGDMICGELECLAFMMHGSLKEVKLL